jgi:hypothetical protein
MIGSVTERAQNSIRVITVLVAENKIKAGVIA